MKIRIKKINNGNKVKFYVEKSDGMFLITNIVFLFLTGKWYGFDDWKHVEVFDDVKYAEAHCLGMLKKYRTEKKETSIVKTYKA